MYIYIYNNVFCQDDLVFSETRLGCLIILPIQTAIWWYRPSGMEIHACLLSLLFGNDLQSLFTKKKDFLPELKRQTEDLASQMLTNFDGFPE